MLHVFTAVPTVRAVARIDEPATVERSGYARDAITLGWEERWKARARRRSDGGFAFATILPRGTLLRGGDHFIFDAERRIVVVRERADAVFVLQPDGSEQWALWAYHLGNSHQPLMIEADAIVCPDVPGMLQVLDHHRIPFTRATRPFTPAAAQLADHKHGL